jgi:hypothetical protein
LGQLETLAGNAEVRRLSDRPIGETGLYEGSGPRGISWYEPYSRSTRRLLTRQDQATPSNLQRAVYAGHGISSEPDRVVPEPDRDQAVPPNTAAPTGDIRT